MKYRQLSKFQIKAEITLMLQKITSPEEMSREQQNKYLAKLGSIEDNDYVVEIFVKELSKADYKKGQVINLFLQELANLEQVSESLWAYIKSPNSPDELKDLSGIILKNLGDTTDPEEFLNYLENPRAIVDKETKKLLEVASINPEAQIDFLDFLFSLPEPEQVNLIKSLQKDYSSECLVNVVISAFESRLIPHMDEFLLKIIGETKSSKAIPVLKEFLEYSKDEKLNKKAQISINTLKLSGINTENEEGSETAGKITQNSDPYEFHTNIPDGLGNQAIIASRERENGDILVMNVVVNDVHGILDCFGFYGISKTDFRRIADKFQEKSTGIPVMPEYCRYLLEKAEKINKTDNLPVPYEYVAWKPLLSDIEPLDFSNIDRMSDEWADEKFVNEGYLLYKFPDFNHWFLEEDDHPAIKPRMEGIVKDLIKKKELYTKNRHELESFLESNLNALMAEIFSKDIKEIYKSRLQNIAFLFNFENLEHFRNIAATLAWLIDPKNNSGISSNEFFREIARKTILEGLLRYQYNLYNEAQQSTNSWNLRKTGKEKTAVKQEFEKNSIEEIMEILCNNQAYNGF